MKLEFERNRERYEFMKWGMGPSTPSASCRRASASCTRSTSNTLARGVHRTRRRRGPDTLVGTDSHTTMINGIGVVGWGVGGIEAEAGHARPAGRLLPDVIGFELTGKLPEGVTATDLVLTVTEMLRKQRWWASSSSSSAKA